MRQGPPTKIASAGTEGERAIKEGKERDKERDLNDRRFHIGFLISLKDGLEKKRKRAERR